MLHIGRLHHGHRRGHGRRPAQAVSEPHGTERESGRGRGDRSTSCLADARPRSGIVGPDRTCGHVGGHLRGRGQDPDGIGRIQPPEQLVLTDGPGVGRPPLHPASVAQQPLPLGTDQRLPGLGQLGHVRAQRVEEQGQGPVVFGHQQRGDGLEDPGHAPVHLSDRTIVLQDAHPLVGDEGVLARPLQSRHQPHEGGVGGAGAGWPVGRCFVLGPQRFEGPSHARPSLSVDVTLGVGIDQLGHRLGGVGGLPAEWIMPPARPHQHYRRDAERPGEGPPGQSAPDGRGSRRHRNGKDEGEERGSGPHGRLGAHHAGEEHGEADHGHADHRQGGIGGAERPDDDEDGTGHEQPDVGAQPLRRRPPKVGKEEQGEGPEHREQGRLGVPDAELGEGEHPGHQDRGPNRSLGGPELGVPCLPPLGHGPVRRRWPCVRSSGLAGVHRCYPARTRSASSPASTMRSSSNHAARSPAQEAIQRVRSMVAAA